MKLLVGRGWAVAAQKKADAGNVPIKAGLESWDGVQGVQCSTKPS